MVAIGNMDDLRGCHAWYWVFILEGTLNCLVTFVSSFIISDFLEEPKWLREDERVYVKSRLLVGQENSTTGLHINVQDVFDVLKDNKIYLGGIMYFSLIVPAYSIQIIQSFKASKLANVRPCRLCTF